MKYGVQTREDYKAVSGAENSVFIVSDQIPLVPEFGEPDGERERKPIFTPLVGNA